MKMNRRWLLFGVIIFLFCALILLLRCCNADTAPHNPCSGIEADEGAVNWEGNKNPSDTKQEGAIAVPGFESLTFKANQVKQHVNFHNPETNNCFFLMTLYVEGKEYWKSGYVEAGKGYYSIELYEPISAGEYDAELLVRCFRSTGAELNSARIEFDLTVLEVE